VLLPGYFAAKRIIDGHASTWKFLCGVLRSRRIASRELKIRENISRCSADFRYALIIIRDP